MQPDSAWHLGNKPPTLLSSPQRDDPTWLAHFFIESIFEQIGTTPLDKSWLDKVLVLGEWWFTSPPISPLLSCISTQSIIVTRLLLAPCDRLHFGGRFHWCHLGCHDRALCRQACWGFWWQHQAANGMATARLGGSWVNKKRHRVLRPRGSQEEKWPTKEYIEDVEYIGVE